MPRIVTVVGSANVDLLVEVAALPRPGETVLARRATRAAGGKGANQAVACQRLGQPTALVARVGDDADGAWLLERLRAEGLDLTRTAATADVATGLAIVEVDDAGENCIAVVSGANATLDVADVEGAADLLADSAVVLLQLEVPLETVLAAATAARAVGATVVLNPAPAVALEPALVAAADLLVPNRSELALLAGTALPSGRDEVVAAVEALGLDGDVVVTLGADGALVRSGGAVELVPAPAVTVVDTTGAGDALCGALAAALAGGASVVEAVRWAVGVAAESTTRRGAQPSYPTRSSAPPAR
jgi:ribokinase